MSTRPMLLLAFSVTAPACNAAVSQGTVAVSGDVCFESCARQLQMCSSACTDDACFSDCTVAARSCEESCQAPIEGATRPDPRERRPVLSMNVARAGRPASPLEGVSGPMPALAAVGGKAGEGAGTGGWQNAGSGGYAGESAGAGGMAGASGSAGGAAGQSGVSGSWAMLELPGSEPTFPIAGQHGPRAGGAP